MLHTQEVTGGRETPRFSSPEFILRFFDLLVRDQEVGGSNPLAPTILFSTAYTLSPSEKVVGS